mmetsp:Transcript_63088/g.86725  ORF Transcript_63088/g.86725 Transcript_63088/m.86725 type:complete len:183 (-) Transcript_63088:659-1207(-)
MAFTSAYGWWGGFMPQRCLVSITEARNCLRLPECFTPHELRDAYYKRCFENHPDVQPLESAVAASERFVNLNSAYELLRQCKSSSPGGESAGFNRAASTANGQELDDEAGYRQSCSDWVGCSAELVEELKADPLFRLWVKGDTYSAEHWRTFLTSHGGLAPRTLRGIISPGLASKKERRRQR